MVYLQKYKVITILPKPGLYFSILRIVLFIFNVSSFKISSFSLIGVPYSSNFNDVTTLLCV